MGKQKPSVWARTIYALIGLIGLSSALTIIFWNSSLAGMTVWNWIIIILATVGALNWGIIAITNNRTKDLFGLIE